MKLEYLTVESIKTGMKEVVTRFGDDAVLLKTIKEGSKYRLLIAHEDEKSANQRTALRETTPAQRLSSAVNDTPLTLAEIDLVTGERRVVLDPPKLTSASADYQGNRARRVVNCPSFKQIRQPRSGDPQRQTRSTTNSSPQKPP